MLLHYFITGIRSWGSNKLCIKPLVYYPRPIEEDLFELRIEGGGPCPNNYKHSQLQFMSVFPVTSNPSTKSPSITSISCKVIPISPQGKWNVCVSRRHHSTKAVIKVWLTSILGTLNNSVKAAASMYCMIRESSPPRSSVHLQHQHFTTPGTSCTRPSIVLGSAHKVIIKLLCINNPTT